MDNASSLDCRKAFADKLSRFFSRSRPKADVSSKVGTESWCNDIALALTDQVLIENTRLQGHVFSDTVERAATEMLQEAIAAEKTPERIMKRSSGANAAVVEGTEKGAAAAKVGGRLEEVLERKGKRQGSAEHSPSPRSSPNPADLAVNEKLAGVFPHSAGPGESKGLSSAPSPL